MSISVRCPSCGKGLTVPDNAAGKRGKCPGCGNPVAIPAGPGAVQAAAPTRPAPAMAPAAAPAARRSKAVSAGGAVTPPKMFKKLFSRSLIYLFLLGPFVMAIGMAAGVGPLIYRVANHKEVTDMTPAERDAYFKESEEQMSKWTPEQKEAFAKTGDLPIMSLIPWYTYLGFAFVGLGGLIMLYSYLLQFILLYKEWALIQDGEARTTPLKAVLLLFVPIFSIYWVFVAIRGLAEDLNKYAKQRQIKAREVSVGFVTTSMILTMIPCTSGIGSLLMFFALNSIKNACVDIAAAKLGEA